MMRWCLVLVLLASLATPSVALAQSGGGNPFGPLPRTPQAPPQQPKPQKINRNESDDGLGGTAFWLIIGTTALIFVVVVFLITRDMRRSTGTRRKRRRLRGSGRPAADAAQALAAEPRHTPGSAKARAKAQQRAKTKAARKQRRRTRSR